MSFNQSKSDKNESQYRKPGGGGRSGSSGQQRTFTGSSGRGGGGFTAPPLVTNPSSVSSTRSIKKIHNAQGVQSRVASGSVNVASTAPAPVQNGSHSQYAHSAVIKPNDMANQRNPVPIPRAPPSQSSTMTSDSTTTPTTPAKGDGAKGFSLQFGSISPGLMNGMQVPARTTSAPPNIAELKRDQARHAASKVAAAVPLASVPKTQLPRMDVPISQHIAGEPNAALKVKRDAPGTSALPASHAQKPPVLPMTGMPIQGPYPQPSMPMQFGGPNPQMQSQGMPTSSLPMPMQMSLQMGNPSQVQQQMFIPGLPHPIMQPQALMHQSQNLGFNPQMTQLSHQMGSPGMNIAPHLSPQQPVKYSSTRRAVKITHPETREEVSLDKKVDVHSDGTSAPRTHHEPPPSYPSGYPIGYYTNTYSSGPQYFAAQSSGHPITSAPLNPIPQQQSRFNYPASQAPHNVPYVSRSPPNSLPASRGGKVASSNLVSSRVTQNVVSSSPVVVTIKPAATISIEKSTEAKVVEKGQTPRISRPDAEISSLQILKDSHTNAYKNLADPKFGSEEMRPESTIDENVAKSSTTLSTDGRIKETAARSESVKDNQKKQVNKGPDHSIPQFGVQASSGLSQAAESSDHSLKMLSSSLPEVNKNSSGAGQSTGHIHIEQSSSQRAAPVDESSSGANSSIQSPAADEVVGAGRVIIGTGVDLSSEQQDPLPAETSGTGKPGKEDIVGEKQNCGSLKQAEMDGKPNLNLELEGNADLVDTTVKHVQLSTPSHAVTDKIDREASKPSINASDYVSGSEAVTEGQSAGCEGDATAVHVKALEGTTRPEKESLETARPTSSSGSASISNKSAIDSNKTKTASTRGKKNLKQILQKADAQGTTSDLYMAYKRPDEKVESNSSIGSSGNISSYEMKAVSELDQDVSVKEKDDGSKAEPDDWEDAADVSTPKLQSMSKRSQELTEQEVGTAKKYTRDFLLTFSEQCTSLPEGLKDNFDIADILSRPSSSSSRGAENTSSARITDRPSSGHKVDRRGSGLTEADRWNKHPSPREMGQDTGYGSMQMGFRPGQGGNVGVLRNPRAQQSAQYPILSGPSGPMHSMQRNNPEADRWRNVNFKGLMPPPQTNMHKAERKYQVGKVTDEEQAKQRKLKGILNKLTPQNFDKLFAQVKEVNIDNVITLTGVISQIFDKALMEPTFCEMYSNFCYELSLALPDLSVDDEKVTFKRLLLNKCQEEFERGEKEEEEANNDDSGEEIKLTDGEKEKEERRLQARRRMLGNIRLIGELYKKSMLTERIMHECIRKLLGQYPNCVEEDIESLCKLMSTIGEMIDHPRGKEYMDKYFGLMAQLSNDMKLSSRVRFMLKDAIDLRKNKWQQRRKVEGPKKIEDVHRDAAQEKHAQSSRLNRGPSMGSGTRRGQPVDFSPRGSGMLSSPVSQGGSFRGLPPVRNYPMQDVRTDERNSFNSRNISVPLPQRPLGDGSITLGPQGGLARGMSIRGQSSVSAVPSAEHSLSHGDIRRTGGLNGFSSMTDRGTSNSREEPVQRLAPPVQDHAASSMNKDRSVPASTPSRGQGILTGQNLSSESVLPDERLREKSIAAIREFYSAKDEKEVDTCVRELNAPRFYPSVISIWVNDSFDRRDPERVLLNKLIVNLSKSRTGQLFMPDQLIKGFEAVLTNLEDAVSDAPKAPEYLGRLLSMLIVENVVSLKEIGGLLYEGGEEPGCLREAGLAGDVLGSILENIKSEKGESVVKEICVSSNLRLEDFRPQEPRKSKKLESFI